MPHLHASGGQAVAAILETALLAEESVQDCVVLERSSERGEAALVAYVVAAGPILLERWRARAQTATQDGTAAVFVVPVTRLPLTLEGTVDAAALARLPVLDDALARRWERDLRELPKWADAAVLVEEHITRLPPRHLNDLLPAWRAGNPERPVVQSHQEVAAGGMDRPGDRVALTQGAPLAVPAGAPRTFIEAIQRVALAPSTHGVTYVETSGPESFLSYAEQAVRARRVLAGLQAAGLLPGDRVILQVDRLDDYCSALWACILGGFVPVTIAVAASFDTPNAVVTKLYNAWAYLDRPVLLASAHLVDPIGHLPALFPMIGVRTLSFAAVAAHEPSGVLHTADPDDVLFLQLSSGSTGVAKCIPQTHRAVLAHIHAVQQFNGYSERDVVLNWLPMDHVGALVMFYHRALYLGCRQVLVQTDVVLADPLRWLDLLANHQVTNTWAPNFGYKLVADRLAAAPTRSWDLSPIRMFINGGEQVTEPVIRTFLERVAPFGVRPQAMQPAYGMAETCTGVTYENRFTLEAGILYLGPTAAGSQVRHVPATTPSAGVLVPVGRPIPGEALRIVDQHDQLLAEGTIGRLQIRGPVVTSGYLNDAAANAEAFAADGWFRTGDLGFLEDGTLTITGREKEIIVVRGANIFCFDIEDAVGAIEGVEATFVGSCAVEDAQTGTEGFAVFFVPSDPAPADLATLVQTIAQTLATRVGITPSTVVPMERAAFPKTTSGKVQRVQLQRWLQEGRFRETLQALDIAQGNANTLPDWFYRPIWRRKDLRPHTAQAAPEKYLLLLNGSSLDEPLLSRLHQEGAQVVVAEHGAGFQRVDQAHYRFDIADASHYQRLLTALQEQGSTPTRIVHLLTYGAPSSGRPALDAVEQAQTSGVLSVLHLLHALAQQPAPTPVTLLAVSSHVQAVRPGDRLAPERSPLLGLLKTAPQELPWLDGRHLDLPATDEDQVDALLRELRSGDHEAEVAYRAGCRYVARLERVQESESLSRPLPFKQGGRYLLTGGLGGVAQEVARLLLQHFDAHLLLVGRSVMPTPARWDAELAQGGPTADSIRAYQALRALGDVRYEHADVADLDRLRELTTAVEAHWQGRLDGVIHLAGVFQDRLLAEETAESFMAALHPKVAGTWALHLLTEERPDCGFVVFSSVNGYFGGYSAGAYAAANAFLDHVVHYRREQLGLPGNALAWSMWLDRGLARQYPAEQIDLARGRGFVPMTAQQGGLSLLAGLTFDLPQVLIGLDESRPRLAPQVEATARGRQRLHAFVAPAAGMRRPEQADADVQDHFGVPAACTLTRLPALPYTAAGHIDRDQLLSPNTAPETADGAPRTDLERRFVAIWCEVLGVPQVGIYDSFFALGGSSLVLARLSSRLRETITGDLDARDLFEAPTIAALSERLTARRQVLDSPPLALSVIPPAPRDRPLPLLAVQTRLWFLDQLLAAKHAYNEAWATRFSGELDQEALARSLTELVARHEALRTAFVAPDGEPQQIIAPALPMPLTLVDVSAISEEARDDVLHRLALQEAQRHFDLTQAPLIRATLYRVAPNDHVLLLVLHHIVIDGWSLGVLRRELAALYAAFRHGEPSPLPPLPFQYADYALWRRDQWQREEREEQLAYWRERLAGLSALPLPLDSQRPGVPSYRGVSVPVRIAPELTGALRALGAEERATLFTVLLAAFQALLARVSGQDDVTVCTPVAGRNRADLEALIGFFVNTVVLRTDLSGAPSFREAVARVREAAAGAFAHQDLPFDQLVEHLRPARDPGHNPLAQIAFALQNAPMASMQLTGLTAAPFPIDIETAKFDLFLELVEGADGLTGRFQFSTDLFTRATVERLAGHFQTLLAAAAADPDRSIVTLPLFDEEERRRVLVDWNDTARPYPRTATIAQLFQEQVLRSPAALAVIYGTQRLTYAELDRRSDQLARHLQHAGVGPDVMVGVFLDRSAELIVALLGVLKAGGAYLLLDLDYPSERLGFMLADAGASLVLTQATHRAALPSPVTALCLDEDWQLIEQADGPLLRPATTGEHLAYVVYTSGSTGQPKGVAVPNRAVLRLVCNTDYVQLTAEDRVAQASTASFDAATFEIWGALLHGACLIGVSKEVALDPPAFTALLRAQQITTLFLTTALFNHLAVSAPGAFSSLRHLLFGGEAVDARRVRQVLQQPPERLLHVYGPTETTTFATWHQVKGVPDDAHSVPIGQPIANTRAYVLDPAGQPVPVGLPGELYIGGDGLARGYFGRPDLTAESFVPDPFSAEAGQRLYRTGDLVRRLFDGSIEFLGRLDHQVKIRGFRIEPGEVTAVLAGLPAVQEAVVVVREDIPGERQLVAYVAPRAGERLPVASLRAALQGTLPLHMVPAAFVVLKALPLNVNGKIDRRALPAPTSAPLSQSDATAPRSELEHVLTAIWLEVLQVPTVDLHANFFDVGGHSLRLMQVLARVREALGRDISVVDLFRYPTIAGLAQYLSGEATPASTAQAAVPPVSSPDTTEGIAIIGMAGRFPGAADLQTFWRNLQQGVEAIRQFSDDELLAAGVDRRLIQRADYVKARGVLDHVESFDAAFFGYSPREADITDPQHRLFLEEAWAAFEHAGYAPTQLTVPVGVFAGVSTSTYLSLIARAAGTETPVDSYQLGLGNDKDHLTTRVAYKLDLRGPGVTVQTACSTSLVAVALACQSLLNRQCDLALAGGASISVPQTAGYVYQPDGILSPDGHCRAYDAAARGTVPGSGVGAVVLKRLADAHKAGDTIHAVIKGFAVNNDGAGKVGFTAPSVSGQIVAIRAAQAMAGCTPESIGYIEGHGTGTPLGDPIELAALRDVFQGGGRPATCALGSVKTNIGHLDAAAGIAGLLKAVLALEHGEIPPSLHFGEANPRLELERSPFFVPAGAAAWPETGLPRRAGVSSFGVGGTNAHVVLEAAPAIGPAPTDPSIQTLLLSAKTAGALERATKRLADHLEGDSKLSLADATFTLQAGRCHFPYRRAVVCADRSEAIARLRATGPTSVVERTGRPAVFLFPGQGAQHVGMAQAIYRTEPVFRAVFDRCADLLTPMLGQDLRSVVFPAEHTVVAAAALDETALAQPALFVVEYALAQLWLARGVTPAAMVGHSIGEYVAACLANVFTLEEGLALVAARGRLMQQLPPGAMLAVALDAERLQSRLSDDLALAAVNAPMSCVVAGTAAVVEQFARDLKAEGIASTRLHATRAFHSPMVEPMLTEFATEVARVRLRPPCRPYLSNVTGTWITSEQAVDPAYWTRHARQTVRFAAGLTEVMKDQSRVLLEVGPGQTLQRLAQSMRSMPVTTVVATLPHPRSRDGADTTLAQAGAQLWLAGVDLDWPATHGSSPRRRIPLPAYPFERERHWVEQVAPAAGPPASVEGSTKRAEIKDWLYAPLWRQTFLPPPFLPAGSAQQLEPGPTWLLLSDGAGVGAALRRRLEEAGHAVVIVVAGRTYGRQGDREYTLSPTDPAQFVALFDDLRRRQLLPGHVLHLWSLDAGALVEEALQGGFYSLLLLVQATGERNGGRIRLDVVTDQMAAVTGEEALHPLQATVMGACRVIPQEYAQIDCRCIDVALPVPGSNQPLPIEQLLAEVVAEPTAALVAYRGRYRWMPSIEHVASVHGALGETLDGTGAWRPGGVYLITGGFGGIGSTLAGYLARAAKAKLVLLGRVPMPDQAQWGAWLSEHDRSDEVGRRIRQVRTLEAAGAEVMVATADVADRQAMAALVQRIGIRFGALHGVIHAAGIAGGGVLQLMTPARAAGILAPKVQGTLALMDAVRDLPLDFVLLCSSLSALVGGAGRADYCAANAFLDAYAHLAARDGRRVISVNWDTWRDVGMAVEAALPADLAAERTARVDRGIRSQEGIDVFQRALATLLPQVAVSTTELTIHPAPRIAPDANAGAPGASPGVWRHDRPAVRSAFVPPQTPTERVVAEAWQDALGITEVGIEDDFFELGGHSLLAIQLLARLRDIFQVEVALDQFFEGQTVARLSETIDRLIMVDGQATQQMVEALNLVERLSEAELAALLEQVEEPAGGLN